MTEGNIFIENAEKGRCTACHKTLRMSNDHEAIFCNVIMAYFNSERSEVIVKCRECKTMNTFPGTGAVQISG